MKMNRFKAEFILFMGAHPVCYGLMFFAAPHLPSTLGFTLGFVENDEPALEAPVATEVEGRTPDAYPHVVWPGTYTVEFRPIAIGNVLTPDLTPEGFLHHLRACGSLDS